MRLMRLYKGGLFIDRLVEFLRITWLNLIYGPHLALIIFFTASLLFFVLTHPSRHNKHANRAQLFFFSLLFFLWSALVLLLRVMCP